MSNRYVNADGTEQTDDQLVNNNLCQCYNWCAKDKKITHLESRIEKLREGLRDNIDNSCGCDYCRLSEEALAADDEAAKEMNTDTKTRRK